VVGVMLDAEASHRSRSSQWCAALEQALSLVPASVGARSGEGSIILPSSSQHFMRLQPHHTVVRRPGAGSVFRPGVRWRRGG